MSISVCFHNSMFSYLCSPSFFLLYLMSYCKHWYITLCQLCQVHSDHSMKQTIHTVQHAGPGTTACDDDLLYRHRQTDRQTDRHTDIQTYRHTDVQIETQTDTHTETHKERYTQFMKQTMHTDQHACPGTTVCDDHLLYRQAYAETYSQSDTDMQAERDIQKDRDITSPHVWSLESTSSLTASATSWSTISSPRSSHLTSVIITTIIISLLFQPQNLSYSQILPSIDIWHLFTDWFHEYRDCLTVFFFVSVLNPQWWTYTIVIYSYLLH